MVNSRIYSAKKKQDHWNETVKMIVVGALLYACVLSVFFFHVAMHMPANGSF